MKAGKLADDGASGVRCGASGDEVVEANGAGGLLEGCGMVA